MRTRPHRLLFLPSLLIALSASAARPMITDDARLTDPGACQVESWVHLHGKQQGAMSVDGDGAAGDRRAADGAGGVVGAAPGAADDVDGAGPDAPAFEAEGAEAVANAVRQIEALERDPIPYTEERPRRDLTGWAYALAAFGLLLLVLAKLAETDFLRAPIRERSAAAAGPAPAAAPRRAAA